MTTHNDLDDAAERHKGLIQQVLAKIGYNLLEFQRIEGALKILSPYLSIPTTSPEVAPLLKFELLLRNKKTLGMLAKRLNEAYQSEDSSQWEEYLQKVVEHRNELVHHFLMRCDSRLDTEEKCRSAISYLDDQREFIDPMVKLTNEMVLGFVSALAEQTNEGYSKEKT